MDIASFAIGALATGATAIASGLVMRHRYLDKIADLTGDVRAWEIQYHHKADHLREVLTESQRVQRELDRAVAQESLNDYERAWPW